MKISLGDLNKEQRRAVEATDGPLLIVAGAGAGKTKTLTYRIGHIIELGTPAEAILAITFTNKAAREMRERVLRLIGSTGLHSNFGIRRGVPWIGTFHGLGAYILREAGEIMGIKRGATILDQDESLKYVKGAMKAVGVDPKEFEPRKIQGIISRHKGDLGGAEDIEKRTANKYLATILHRVYVEYEKRLRQDHMLDFDDLLEKTVRLFERHPEVLARFRAQWRYVHVDEYQDTNEVQYRLVKLLAGEHKNICVVGDSDQNIYSWRGASIANILEFEEDFPGATVILLEENYRSTQTILTAANQVIAKNTLRKPKNLFTRNAGGDPIALFAAYDEGEEARRIAGKIASLIEAGVRPGEIAVLYRTNFQSRVIEEALLYSGIPYQVLGVRFFERKEVRDVVSYLRAGLNPGSALDIERAINVPPRGIGKVTLEKVLSGKTESLPEKMREKVEAFYRLLDRIGGSARQEKPSQTIRFIVRESGIERALSEGDDEDAERLANVRELATVAARYDALPPEEGIAEMLADIALESDQDTMKNDRDSVRLMTVHAAKGLEFHHVFVTGLEQDLFPSRRAWDDSKDLSEREEERRLFYVALTRAAKRVYLSYASFRTIFGERQVNVPSEFLSDIDEGLIHREEAEGARTIPGKRKVSLLGWDEDEPTVYL